MPMLNIRETTLSCDDTGVGRNALVLIHGHPFNKSMWKPQERVAAEIGWRVVRPDLRGYGQSGEAANEITLEEFAADIEALMEALSIDRAVIGGLSMGGQIAMAYCDAYPGRVVGLLLAATFPRVDTEKVKQQRRDVADRLEAEGMASYAEELIGKMLSPGSLKALPDVRDHVLDMMRTTPARGAAAALRGRARRRNYEDTLGSFAWPTLVVVGDQDAYTTRDDAELMRKRLPDGQLLWLEGAGHMPNLEEPKRFNEAMIALLERVAAQEAMQ